MSLNSMNKKLTLQMEHWKDTPKGERPMTAGGRAVSKFGKAVWHKKKERGSSIAAIKAEQARARASRKK